MSWQVKGYAPLTSQVKVLNYNRRTVISVHTEK
jgi:hypothetical protein